MMKNASGVSAAKMFGVVLTATAASLVATAGPAYAATGFDPAPMKKHKHDDGDRGGNAIQVPIQACNNNVGNNNGIGILGHGKAKGGNNKGDCKQKTSSH